jgi:predicted Zn finger-like uncharacterized protein
VYTQCPHCQTLFRIRADQLRAANGKAHCCRCERVFSALENLIENSASNTASPIPQSSAAETARPEEVFELGDTHAAVTNGLTQLLQELERDDFTRLDNSDDTLDISGPVVESPDFGINEFSRYLRELEADETPDQGHASPDHEQPFAGFTLLEGDGEDEPEIPTIQPAALDETETLGLDQITLQPADIGPGFEVTQVPPADDNQQAFQFSSEDIAGLAGDDDFERALLTEDDITIGDEEAPGPFEHSTADSSEDEAPADTASVAPGDIEAGIPDDLGIEVHVEEYQTGSIENLDASASVPAWLDPSQLRPADAIPVYYLPTPLLYQPPETLESEADDGDEVQTEHFPHLPFDPDQALPDIEPTQSETLTIEDALAQSHQRGRRTFWGSMGAVLLILLAVLQMAWFGRNHLINYPGGYNLLVRLCAFSGCEPPTRRSPEQFTVVSRSMTSHPQQRDALLLSLRFANEAEFAQPFPLLQLSLFDTNERVIARRIFTPGEYLPATAGASGRIDPAQTIALQMALEDPGDSVTGFKFDFR